MSPIVTLKIVAMFTLSRQLKQRQGYSSAIMKEIDQPALPSIFTEMWNEDGPIILRFLCSHVSIASRLQPNFWSVRSDNWNPFEEGLVNVYGYLETPRYSGIG